MGILQNRENQGRTSLSPALRHSPPRGAQAGWDLAPSVAVEFLKRHQPRVQKLTCARAEQHDAQENSNQERTKQLTFFSCLTVIRQIKGDPGFQIPPGPHGFLRRVSTQPSRPPAGITGHRQSSFSDKSLPCEFVTSYSQLEMSHWRKSTGVSTACCRWPTSTSE